MATSCDRQIIHGSHVFLDGAGVEHGCPGLAVDRRVTSWRERLDRVMGEPCSWCGKRGSHYCDLKPAGPGTNTGQAITHGRLLDGTVLCPDAILDDQAPGTSVFLDLITCPVCAGRLARIQGRPTAAPAEPRALRPGRRRKAGAA